MGAEATRSASPLQPRYVVRVVPSAPEGEAFAGGARNLLEDFPQGLCEIWHPRGMPAGAQVREILADASERNGGAVMVIDCGYDSEGGDNRSSDPLSWYVYGDAAQGLLERGASTRRQRPPGSLLPELVERAAASGSVAERGARGAMVAMVAIGSLSSDVVDLAAPFAPLHGGPLTFLDMSDAAAFITMFEQVASSPGFRAHRRESSFLFIVRGRSPAVHHVVLIAKERHHEALLQAVLAAPPPPPPAHRVPEPALPSSLDALDLVRFACGHTAVAAAAAAGAATFAAPLVIARVPDTKLDDTLGLGARLAEDGPPRAPQQQPPARRAAAAATTTTTTTAQQQQQMQHDLRACLAAHTELLKETEAALAALSAALQLHRRRRTERDAVRRGLDGAFAACAATEERALHFRALLEAAKAELEEVRTETSRVRELAAGCPSDTPARGELERQRRANDERLRNAAAEFETQQRAAEAEAARQLAADLCRQEAESRSAQEARDAAQRYAAQAAEAKRAAQMEEVEVRAEREVMATTVVELRAMVGTARDALQRAREAVQRDAADAASDSAIRAECDRAALDAATLTAALEAKQARVVELEDAISAAAFDTGNVQRRVADNAHKLLRAAQELFMHQEAAQRTRVVALQRESFLKLIRDRFADLSAAQRSGGGGTPLIDADALAADVHSQLAGIARRRSAVESERRALEMEEAAVRAEIAGVLQAQEQELAALNEEAAQHMRHVTELREKRLGKEAAARQQLVLQRATYRALHDELLAAIHDESYAALSAHSRRVQPPSPDPRDPRRDSSGGNGGSAAGQGDGLLHFDETSADEVCRLYLQWQERRQRAADATTERDAAHRRLQRARADGAAAAAALAADRATLGELEDELRVATRDAEEATEALSTFLQKQRSHRAEMERAIADCHAEGQRQLDAATRDVAAATIAQEHLEQQVREAQRDANNVAAEIETSRCSAAAQLERQLLDITSEVAQLEERLHQRQREQQRISDDVQLNSNGESAAHAKGGLSHLGRAAAPWSPTAAAAAAPPSLPSPPPPSPAAREAAFEQLRNSLQDKRKAAPVTPLRSPPP